MFCVELGEAWKDIALLDDELQAARTDVVQSVWSLCSQTTWLLSWLWDPEQVSWPLRASLPHL